jgi:hypothetical protein
MFAYRKHLYDFKLSTIDRLLSLINLLFPRNFSKCFFNCLH